MQIYSRKLIIPSTSPKFKPFFFWGTSASIVVFLFGRLYSDFLQIPREHLQQDCFPHVKKWVLEYCFVKSEKRADLKVINDWEL